MPPPWLVGGKWLPFPDGVARMTIKSLAGAVFLFALVVNPAYFGCGPTESEPNFGEAEMLQSLDAANETGTWDFEVDGVSYELTLSLMQVVGEDVIAVRHPQSMFASTAHACGSRSFLMSASACVTVTTLQVEGELTLRRVEDGVATELVSNAAVSGDLTAYGETLRDVSMNLVFGDARTVSLSAEDARTFVLTAFSVVGL